MNPVTIVGAGLAGCEAAYQLAKRNIPVRLYEMRPKKMTPAHKSGYFAELVCSNSLRGDTLMQGVGVLKAEMRLWSSLIIDCAALHRVPAGHALAVDREGFAAEVHRRIREHPLIEIVEDEVKRLPEAPAIIASGPLTSEALLEALRGVIGEETLHFFDAASPVIRADSVDTDVCYWKSRYDKGTADYLNCPMDEVTYKAFYEALSRAPKTPLKDFEYNVFERCMPIEEMARRGEKTLLFGPMKPVGLEQGDGKRPHAVVQLRQDDARSSLFNLVGFQTRLTQAAQKAIVRMIPGLEKAVIVRYGAMHKNTYVNAPMLLDETYAFKTRPDCHIAGQLAGVEGYVESASSGLVAAISLYRSLTGKSQRAFPKETMMGALSDYVATTSKRGFQPMNANFGLLPEPDVKLKKRERKPYLAERALSTMKTFRETVDDRS